MVIPIHTSFRGVIFVSLIVLGLGIFVVVNSSKDKSDYNKATGTIEYLEREFQNLPTRHKGDFRYLKVDTYPYVFEIYKPNSQPTDKDLDELKAGDIIDIYHYETSDTRIEGVNRFAQFIDKQDQPYFVRSGFQKQLGYIIIGLCALMNLMAFVLWKKRKLKW